MGIHARRSIVTIAASGVVGVATAGRAEAAPPSPVLAARLLKVGDLVVGPRSGVVRVSAVKRLATGRRRVRYTDPTTGASTPFDADVDRRGFAADHPFVLIRRGVPAASVVLSRREPVPDRVVVDGGAP